MQFEFELGVPATEQPALESEEHTVADDKSKGFRFTVTWYFTVAIENPISGTDTPIATRRVLGKLAGLMVLEVLGKKFIENLVCREPEEAAELKEEAKKRNEEQIKEKEKEKEADKVKEKMDETKEKSEH